MSADLQVAESSGLFNSVSLTTPQPLSVLWTKTKTGFVSTACDKAWAGPCILAKAEPKSSLIALFTFFLIYSLWLSTIGTVQCCRRHCSLLPQCFLSTFCPYWVGRNFFLTSAILSDNYHMPQETWEASPCLAVSQGGHSYPE